MKQVERPCSEPWTVGSELGGEWLGDSYRVWEGSVYLSRGVELGCRDRGVCDRSMVTRCREVAGIVVFDR